MNPSLDHIVILADESVNWKIAGLRQLDRLVLALDEFAKSATPESKIDIFIFWRPDMAIEKRWRPSDPRLTRCNILEFSESALPGARVLNTRLLVKRSGLETFLHDSVSIDLDHSIVNESELWETLWRQFEKYFPRSAGSAKTRIVALRSASQRHSALRAVAASRQRQVARRICFALFESPDLACR